ncbi:MAG: hypothetical protein U5K00_16275 [Melioribacteraceae bacterium]|nr:hypothetical protein [Melioribacteraceae bacterium]
MINISEKGFIEYLNKNLPAEIAEEKCGTSGLCKSNITEEQGEKFWMEWIVVRGTQVAEFHKHLRSVARKYNPHFIVWGNMSADLVSDPLLISLPEILKCLEWYR